MTSVAIHLGGDDDYVCVGGAARVESSAGDGSSVLAAMEDAFTELGGRVVPTPDALALLVERAISGVQSPHSVESVVFTHPTHWGAARIRRYREAAQRFTFDVTTVPLATVVARRSGQDGISRRTTEFCVVLESSEAGTVATYVECTSEDARILGSDTDLGADDAVEAVMRVADGRSVHTVLVCDGDAVRDVEAFRAQLDTRLGLAPIVRVVSSEEIAESLYVGWERTPEADREPVHTHWLSASQRHVDPQENRVSGRSGRRATLVAVASVAVVLSAVALVVYVGRTPDTVSADSGTQPSPAEVPSQRPSSSTLPSSSTPPIAAPVVEELGLLKVELPPDWRSSDTSTSRDRFDLTPMNGSGRRIVLVQNDVRDGTGYDEVAATLREQIAGRENSDRFSELDRDVVFGGRPGISYTETPGDDSRVNWHVLLERGVQVSVGCQFQQGQWADISEPCEHVVRSLEVVK